MMHYDNLNNINSNAFMDLEEDLELLMYLIQDSQKKLEKINKLSSETKHHLISFSSKNITHLIDTQQKILSICEHRINDIQGNLQSNDINKLDKLVQEKNDTFDMIRSIYGIIGATTVSYDWQSPSFGHSVRPMAGLQTGKIINAINDYKRDKHLDCNFYEKKFVDEYIDTTVNISVHPYLTASGMAAFTTILSTIIMENANPNRKILCGSHIYFECKDILIKSFGSRLIIENEYNTNQFINTIHKYNPLAIFIDTLTNEESPVKIDISRICSSVIKTQQNTTYMVIDNTCTSISFQPFKTINTILSPFSPVRIILFESLNKYHQFGLDRVMGGIIIASGKDVGKINEYRDHLGTIIPDATVYSIPTPNRLFLAKRLNRLNRNCIFLSTYLQEVIEKSNSKIFDRINYPKLNSDKTSSGSINFSGSFFSIVLQPKYKKIDIYQKLISQLLQTAAKNKVNILRGTSFGLDTTRVYVTASHTASTVPFIRISMGTENILLIRKMAAIFAEVMINFR